MVSEERGNSSETERNRVGLDGQKVKQPNRGSQRNDTNSRQ